MGKRVINMEIEEEVYKMLKEYASATGRSMTWVTENGIKTAVSTDCRYGDFPVVPVLIKGVIWRMPEPLAKAVDELIQTKGKK